MIYTLARDVGAKLLARKFPVRVAYGPERLQREGYDPVIVIERDRGGSDRIGPAVGVQRNARKRMVRMLAVRATIYAVSTLPGAMIHDHERDCERLIDALLVALDEWQAAERAGALEISEARYLAAADRNDVETWPGVVYVIRFFVRRAVYALTYEGDAKPEAAAPGFMNATRAALDGNDYENVPEPS